MWLFIIYPIIIQYEQFFSSSFDHFSHSGNPHFCIYRRNWLVSKNLSNRIGFSFGTRSYTVGKSCTASPSECSANHSSCLSNTLVHSLFFWLLGLGCLSRKYTWDFSFDCWFKPRCFFSIRKNLDRCLCFFWMCHFMCLQSLLDALYFLFSARMFGFGCILFGMFIDDLGTENQKTLETQ